MESLHEEHKKTPVSDQTRPAVGDGSLMAALNKITIILAEGSRRNLHQLRLVICSFSLKFKVFLQWSDRSARLGWG